MLEKQFFAADTYFHARFQKDISIISWLLLKKIALLYYVITFIVSMSASFSFLLNLYFVMYFIKL